MLLGVGVLVDAVGDRCLITRVERGWVDFGLLKSRGYFEIRDRRVINNLKKKLPILIINYFIRTVLTITWQLQVYLIELCVNFIII